MDPSIYKFGIEGMLMQIWAKHSYHDSDITTIVIAIVIYYRNIAHYRYYCSALSLGIAMWIQSEVWKFYIITLVTIVKYMKYF